MRVAIPPEFESFAREQVEAGNVASEEEAVAKALRDYLEQIEDLRALVKLGMDQADRGEDVDGDVFMQDLIAETRARYGV